MLMDLYIINEAGLAIYTHNWGGAFGLDEQLITGFLTAISDFSKEAIRGSHLNSLDLDIGQLVLYKHPDSHLTIAAICDPRDNLNHVQKILRKIHDSFLSKFPDAHLSSNIEKFQIFTRQLDKIVRLRTYPRNKLTLSFAIIVGLALLTFLFFWTTDNITLTLLYTYIQSYSAYLQVFFQKITINPSEWQIWADWLFTHFMISTLILIFALNFPVLIMYLPSAFIAGFIAGNRKRGYTIAFTQIGFLIVQNWILFTFLANDSSIRIFGLSLVYLGVSSLFTFAALFPLIIIMTLAGSQFGGYLMDIWRLHPIVKIKSKKSKLAKLASEQEFSNNK
ncbi:MAG: hypothetical protein ACTSRW_05290 [Candidatus Helarchaeota archaeon]